MPALRRGVKMPKWCSSCVYGGVSMAVESRSAGAGTLGTPPLVRYLLLATAATLGVTGAAAAVISAVSGFLVYQYARARGPWGTDEPPDGMAEDVTFAS